MYILGEEAAYKYHGQQGYNYPLKTPTGEFIYISTVLETIEWPGNSLFYHFVEHFPQLKYCFSCYGDDEFYKYYTKIENGNICYGKNGKQIIEEESEDLYMPEWDNEQNEELYLKKASEILDIPVNLRRAKIQALYI